MFQWRITKYNPKYRNKKGFYTRDDWTSISDVEIDKKDALASYLIIEDKYINAVIYFMEHLQINRMTVKGLEKKRFIIQQIKKNSEIYPQEMIDLFSIMQENLVLNQNQVIMICRLILREHIWCKLISIDLNFFIHFGYDYYMYVGNIKDCPKVIARVKKDGLFVEKIASPYI